MTATTSQIATTTSQIATTTYIAQSTYTTNNLTLPQDGGSPLMMNEQQPIMKIQKAVEDQIFERTKYELAILCCDLMIFLSLKGYWQQICFYCLK